MAIEAQRLVQVCIDMGLDVSSTEIATVWALLAIYSRLNLALTNLGLQ